MKTRQVSMSLAALLLAACGGGAGMQAESAAPSFLATTTVVSGDATFTGARNDYNITKTSSGYVVTNKTSGAAVSVPSTAKLTFADFTVTLSIATTAASIAAADLQSIVELYIAFFNRVPDAEGMDYWIKAFKGGMTLAQIGDAFYALAVQYADVTGYSASMSTADFVAKIYENVLGRTGTTAPTKSEVDFWVGELSAGRATRASLIATMMSAARGYANDATYGWVTALLNNKVSVGTNVAILQGLSWRSATDSVTKGKLVAASVTSTSTASALAAVGVSDSGFSMTKVTPTTGVGSVNYTGAYYCPFSQSVLNSGLGLTATVNSSCTSTMRNMTGNGVPDHVTGAFPNSGNPNAVKAITVNFGTTLNPAITSSTGTAVDHVIGYAYNGVKFDPATAESYQNAGVWKIEALNQSYFPFGVDSSNAHVQPDGAYHYHGMPEAMLTRLGKGQAMTLVGFAVDGFPIYARYGYTDANNAGSAIKVMKSSWRMKSAADSGRPSTAQVPMGTFTQDYEYVDGLGDLDKCNGRTGVTPEFPAGIYHYYVTDAYPYIQRCIKGTSTVPPGP